MTAPAAPVITARYQLWTALLRWRGVSGAATYGVYRNGVLIASPAATTNSWEQYSLRIDPGDLIKMQAINAGAEASADSNVLTVGGLGSASSFPAGPPRGPYTGPFG